MVTFRIDAWQPESLPFAERDTQRISGRKKSLSAQATRMIVQERNDDRD